MRVNVIIPIYYCDPSLFLPIETCLSTLKTCYPSFKQILINDGSPLEVPSYWDIAYENVVNLGYVQTVNRGLREADGDVLIIANDDLQFFPGCLDRFIDLEDNVIASPADSASGDLDTFGCIFGMTRATFEKMGYLDERFKNYFADEEYYNRAKVLGVDVVKWKDIVIPHMESATFNLLNKEVLLEEDRAKLA
jgi:GT2 family glycosyltransferase